MHGRYPVRQVLAPASAIGWDAAVKLARVQVASTPGRWRLDIEISLGWDVDGSPGGTGPLKLLRTSPVAGALRHFGSSVEPARTGRGRPVSAGLLELRRSQVDLDVIAADS